MPDAVRAQDGGDRERHDRVAGRRDEEGVQLLPVALRSRRAEAGDDVRHLEHRFLARDAAQLHERLGAAGALSDRERVGGGLDDLEGVRDELGVLVTHRREPLGECRKVRANGCDCRGGADG